jgi:hypothetical protein
VRYSNERRSCEALLGVMRTDKLLLAYHWNEFDPFDLLDTSDFSDTTNHRGYQNDKTKA